MSDRVKAYATGIYAIASGEGQAERVERELFNIGNAVATNAGLHATLSDARVPSERKAGVVADLLGGRASDLTTAIVSFVVAAGRANELGEIAKAISTAAASSQGLSVATVRSAIALDDDTVARLAAALGKATGKEVEVKVVVDPSVLGGIVATVGDTVIDGSVQKKLAGLRSALTA
jgi:F-type H+-transporting ATPase subunit delta